MIVGRTESGEQHAGEENGMHQIHDSPLSACTSQAVKNRKQARNSDNCKRHIGYDIPEIRDAGYLQRRGKIMLSRILRDRRR